MPSDVQKRVLECTAKYVRLARTVFGAPLPMPQVAFDLRGRTAGLAYPSRNVLRFNSVLLVENEASFYADTIPHEVAHLVAERVYGKGISAHGHEWQSVMRRFGVVPRRTHNYDVTNSAVGGAHRYTCNCGKTFVLSTKQHRRAAKGLYICKKCRCSLQPVGEKARVSCAPAAVPAPPPKVSSAPAPQPQTRPSAPVPASRPATPAQLQFALDLAHRLGIALQPENLASFQECHAFIERHKVLAAVRPTERQLRYAQDLSRRHNREIPAEALADGRVLSAWIERNR